MSSSQYISSMELRLRTASVQEVFAKLYPEMSERLPALRAAFSECVLDREVARRAARPAEYLPKMYAAQAHKQALLLALDEVRDWRDLAAALEETK